MNRRYGEFLATGLTGAVLLSGCNSEMSADSPTAPSVVEGVAPSGAEAETATDTDTVTISPTDTVEVESEPVFLAGKPVDVDVYRLKADAGENDILTDNEINQRLATAAMYVSYSTDGFYRIQLRGVDDIVVKPTGQQYMTEEACYTDEDITDAADQVRKPSANGALVQLISNHIDMCRPPDASGEMRPTLAMAAGDYSYYSIANISGELVSQYDPQLILH